MRILGVLITLSIAAVSGSALAGKPDKVYGTLIHKDGTMTVIIRHNNSALEAYAAQIKKNGVSGGCVRESMSAYQLRQAYTRAQSQWRLGYIPKKFTCEN